METRVNQTIALHDKGYNCAQAVACTYCDLVGLDERTLFMATEGLGYGQGSADGTCGALAGACLLAGLAGSTGNLEAPDSKAATYEVSAKIMTTFLKQNGSVLCKDLKGLVTGAPLRSCTDCIKDAAKLAEEVLFAENNR